MIHHVPASRQPLTRRTLLAGATALPAAGLLAACGGGDEKPAAGASGPPDEVTYVTSFGALGRDSYVWVADALGFFEEQNIRVEISLGAGSTPNIQSLQAGNAQFAVGDTASAVKSWADGDDGFRCIAFIQQRSLVALMSTNPAVRVPADLEGGVIAVAQNTVTDYLLPAWAAGSEPRLDLGTVEKVYVEPQALIPTMASGQVDAIEQFVVGRETLKAQADGRDPQVFVYDDAITGLLGITLMTTPEMIVERRDLCVRFQSALLRGLEYALANPEQAGRILNEAEPDSDPDTAAAEMRAMEPYVAPYAPLGAASPQAVGDTIALMKSPGPVPSIMQIKPEDLVEFSLLPTG